MWYQIAILLLSIVAAGCNGPNQINYVIPNGFHGTVIIIHREGAPELPVVNGRYVLNVPKDGRFVYGGYDPFVSYLPTARFANGAPIWVRRYFDDRPEEGQVGLFGGYTTRQMRGKLDGSQFEQVGEVAYHIFIGTEEQWKSSQ